MRVRMRRWIGNMLCSCARISLSSLMGVFFIFIKKVRHLLDIGKKVYLHKNTRNK